MNAVAIQHNVSDIERMARAIAVSNLFGVQNPEQAIALCLIAQAEGRHPASAAQDYHIIKGRPSKKADAMLRDFLSAGGKVDWHTLDDTIADATFSHASGGSVRISWDMARAKTAGLATDMWKKYPRQMLRSRVVSEGVRTVFPMATSGMYVPEEVQEFDDKPAKAAIAPPDAAQKTIEASPVPDAQPTLSKAKTRDLYAELRDEIDACQSLEDLSVLWRSPAFQNDVKSLKSDWQDSITEHKEQRKADLTPPHVNGVIPPNFDNLEVR